MSLGGEEAPWRGQWQPERAMGVFARPAGACRRRTFDPWSPTCDVLLAVHVHRLLAQAAGGGPWLILGSSRGLGSCLCPLPQALGAFRSPHGAEWGGRGGLEDEG